MNRGIRVLWGAAAFAFAVALSGCIAAPQPVVTRLPTDGSASVAPTPSPATTSPVMAAPSPLPTTQPAPTATSSTSPLGDGVTDCGGRSITLAGSTGTFRIAGDCPDVRVEGNGVLLEASSARVGKVVVSGDRIEMRFSDVAGVTVQGNDITTFAVSAGSVVIRGDRNRVDASGSIASVLLAGNDNVVTSPRTGAVDDQGQRNTVG